MVKLLMGITLSEVGGSQRVVFDIIKNLPENIYDITLLTVPGGELIDWINELNSGRFNKVKIIELNSMKRNISIIHDFITFINLLWILKNMRFDVAHFHNSKMGILGRTAAKIAGIPKIYYTVHGWGLNKTNTGSSYHIMSFLESKISHFTTKVIFVSKKNMELGINNGWATKDGSCLIYNSISDENIPFINIRDSLKIPDNLPLIAFVARMAEPKDPIFAVKVSHHLLSNGYNHILILIGSGPKFSDCLHLIKSLGIEKNVLMLGKRIDVRSILKEVDIFCLYTNWEGMPISILEAMMSGIPVIANNVGGIPELINHNETGYLLDEFNVDKAANFLAILINDKEKRISMGATAREVALRNHNLESMINQYRKLYEE